MKKACALTVLSCVLVSPAFGQQSDAENELQRALKEEAASLAAENGTPNLTAGGGGLQASGQSPPKPKPVESPTVPADDCTPLLSIASSYAITGDTYAAAKKEFDERMGRVEQFVASQSMKKFQVETLSFTIRHDSGGPAFRGGNFPSQPKPVAAASYKLNGNAEFQVDSSENAFKLGQYLTQEKFEVTVSNKPVPDLDCLRNQSKPVMPGQVKPKPAVPAIPVPTGTPPLLEK